MADEDEEQPERDGGDRNRMQFAVIGALVALMVIGAIAYEVGKGEPPPMPPPPPPPDNARALLVPTDDSARLIVIPPCGVPPVTDGQQTRPGTVRLRLPQGPESRAVIVPNCTSPKPVLQGPGAVTAVVLPVGTISLSSSTFGLTADSQVVLPPGSEARTVIMPPCEAKLIGSSSFSSAPTAQRRQDIILSGGAKEDGSIVAPGC